MATNPILTSTFYGTTPPQSTGVQTGHLYFPLPLYIPNYQQPSNAYQQGMSPMQVQWMPQPNASGPVTSVATKILEKAPAANQNNQPPQPFPMLPTPLPPKKQPPLYSEVKFNFDSPPQSPKGESKSTEPPAAS